MNTNETLLNINNLSIGFAKRGKVNTVVDSVSLGVKKGEILGIVGESGSGKSITALATMGLLPDSAKILSGGIYFLGNNLLAMKEKEFRKLRGSEISMVFQDSMTSFNPLLTVGTQIEETLRLHSNYVKEKCKALTLEALKKVGLSNPHEIYHMYPHQLSGGMRQRAMIAMAMIAGSKLIIADEPTTALDVTTQDKILRLLKKMNAQHGTSIILISHNLKVIQSICTRAIVMKDGKIEESGTVKKLFTHPDTDYTKMLISAIPMPFSESDRKPSETFFMGSKKNNNANSKNRTLPVNHKKEQPGILTIQNLNVFYSEKALGLFGKKTRKQVIHDVSLSVSQGETFGIVGESGSGKSTLVKAIVGLNKEIEGTIKINDVAFIGDASSVSKPQMVFQDPYGSLNPTKKISWILEEPLRLQTKLSKTERMAKVHEIIEQVGLTTKHLERYPSQLSGGQRQRVAIAAALIVNPKLVILDEPVSSLDVTIQAQILQLLKDLQKKYNLTYLFISHDLNVIFQMCDRVCVIYKGKIVEMKEARELFYYPQHDYTKELLKSAMIQAEL
ncbi:dipeptide ABC transporter ATP-binding protein [Defluviitalea raffinosedens]|jgi:peptide/nickel transport system ATP-binding protein|uniref:dipeptide ABC transporter ATP-binding protein n=1 Tax=Defluviitalea raffinosedens TaxID=1450156 RepID=UPI00195629F4|nr:ABC transporter ATP-binding protein [Defluviitalea raffinosedens]MBM7686693.1 peptide/nickel transport system ATP-binding protein [Defluviitalea raffinosedens]MBZ4667933.1 transporter ATP-binding protein [Defluviitaleaceae bacterium]